MIALTDAPSARQPPRVARTLHRLEAIVPSRKRPQQRKKKPAKTKRRFSRRLQVGLVVVLAGVGAWLLWPYWQLSQQFGVFSTQAPSRVYGRPTVLATGQLLRPAALVDELADLGYTRVESGLPEPGRFTASDSRVTVHLRRFPTPSGAGGGGVVDVGFGRDWLQSLTVNGREVRRASLEPPLLATLYGPERKERRPVALDALPEELIQAVLAAEDASFFRHAGLSVKGISRAAWQNIQGDGGLQGGSTLTQQLVKNLYLTHERTWARKAREAVLAVLLELRWEKREILEAYLNEIYWGQSGGANLMGVGAAARAYFGKDAEMLSLREAATLAGMIKAPNNYSPIRQPQRAKSRRDWVLGRMRDLGWLDETRYQEVVASPVRASPQEVIVRRAPYFVDRALAEVEERFGVDAAGTKGHAVLTTLSWRDQRAAEESLAWGLEALESGWEQSAKGDEPLQAALVSVDPTTGEILAWVGGRDYGASQFDRASQARRQAGSAFKPVVYASAFRAGTVHPATLLEDMPLTVQTAGLTWEPQNDDREHRGWVTVRRAIEDSLNVPTARVALDVGLDHVLETARRLGITGRLRPFPALALGAFEVTPEELTRVYATLAAGGMRWPQHGVTAVLDGAGEPIAGHAVGKPERALSPQVAYLLTSILQGVVDRGTADSVRRQGLMDPLAGKTGTTNGRRDSWFGGYSPERTTLVWVGYDDNRETRLSGSRAALPIWGRFIWKVRPPGGYANFIRPDGIELATVDPLSGMRATLSCPDTVREVFLQGDAPWQHCYLHGRRSLDRQIGARPPEVLPRQEAKKRPWWKRVFGRGKNKKKDDG